MGTVYKARQLDLDRVVALKFLHAGLLADEESLARFEREAQLLAALRSNRISAACSYGRWNDNVPFIVLEYLPGESLAQLVERQGNLTWRLSLRIATDLAIARRHAHEHGVVHRDLKPANIFLQPQPDAMPPGAASDATTSAPCIKVTDFGLAKLLRAQEQGGDSLTSAVPPCPFTLPATSCLPKPMKNPSRNR